MNGLPRSGGSKPYPYELMLTNPTALDRLDIKFRWGRYGIHSQRFHHTTFAPGKPVHFHKHSEYEFHFIPRGKGKVILGDEPFSLYEGLMYLTGPGVLHYQEADAVEAMDELCLHIDIVCLDEGEPATGGEPPSPEEWGARLEYAEADACISQLKNLPLRPAADTYRAMECFLTAYRAWQENQPGLVTTIKQAIIQILLRMTRTYNAESPADVPARNMNDFRYQLAVQFIRDNYMEPLTLDIVAERVRISPRQLQRIFKDQTGGTFSEYLEHVRVTQVCAELSQSELTIDRIALQSGFTSANYLHYVFKRKMGMTPMQYRSSLRRRES